MICSIIHWFASRNICGAVSSAVWYCRIETDIPAVWKRRSCFETASGEKTGFFDPIIIITNNDVLLNASVEEITKHLYFEYGAAKRDDALYSEMLPGGYMNVVRNDSGEESLVNIEGLFNAVLKNSRIVKSMFQ